MRGGEGAQPRDYAMPGQSRSRDALAGVLRAARRHRGPNRSLRLVLGAIVLAAHIRSYTAKDLGTLDLLSKPVDCRTPTVSWHRDEYAAWAWTFIDAARFSMTVDVWVRCGRRRPSPFTGVNYDFEDVWVEPKAHSAGGRALVRGSTVPPTPSLDDCQYGSGFNRWIVRRTKSAGPGYALAAEGGAPAEIEMSVASEALRRTEQLASSRRSN